MVGPPLSNPISHNSAGMLRMSIINSGNGGGKNSPPPSPVPKSNGQTYVVIPSKGFKFLHNLPTPEAGFAKFRGILGLIKKNFTFKLSIKLTRHLQ